MKKERFELRLTAEERQLLEELAARYGLTMTEVMVRALRSYAPPTLRRDPISI